MNLRIKLRHNKGGPSAILSWRTAFVIREVLFYTPLF